MKSPSFDLKKIHVHAISFKDSQLIYIQSAYRERLLYFRGPLTIPHDYPPFFSRFPSPKQITRAKFGQVRMLIRSHLLFAKSTQSEAHQKVTKRNNHDKESILIFGQFLPTTVGEKNWRDTKNLFLSVVENVFLSLIDHFQTMSRTSLILCQYVTHSTAQCAHRTSWCRLSGNFRRNSLRPETKTGSRLVDNSKKFISFVSQGQNAKK